LALRQDTSNKELINGRSGSITRLEQANANKSNSKLNLNIKLAEQMSDDAGSQHNRSFDKGTDLFFQDNNSIFKSSNNLHKNKKAVLFICKNEPNKSFGFLINPEDE
jgi:hypothetical protein